MKNIEETYRAMSKGKTSIEIELNDVESSVFNCIKSLLLKNEVFQMNSEFINYCIKNTKLPEERINAAIFSLLYRKMIVMGTTLTRNEVLQNENRLLIYQQIQSTPGIHIREICNKLSKSNGVIRAHLKVLETFDFIRRKNYTNPKFSLLFLKEQDEKYDDFFLIMKNGNDQKILKLLIRNTLTLSEMANALEVHHSTIQYHIEKLVNLNLIVQQQFDHERKYSINKIRLENFIEFLDHFIG